MTRAHEETAKDLSVEVLSMLDQWEESAAERIADQIVHGPVLQVGENIAEDTEELVGSPVPQLAETVGEDTESLCQGPWVVEKSPRRADR